MALLSDLVRIVAEVEGLEEVSVGIFARAARESGYISQGGRGRSAAKMTVRDAANLLIAVNGCSLAKEVPTKVGLIRELPVDYAHDKSAIGLCKEGATFGGDLEILLNIFAAHEKPEELYSILRFVNVEFWRPIVKYEIEILHPIGDDLVRELATYSDFRVKDELPIPDRVERVLFGGRTLQAVARAIAN